MASVVRAFDDRRSLAVLPNKQQAIEFASRQFLHLAKDAIAARGVFTVALSGGHTPKAVFEDLLLHSDAINWAHVKLFWSDERAVPPDAEESNYHMAMTAAFSKLPIPPENIHRMYAERDIDQEAIQYEALIKANMEAFDLVMLGMGDDGHTASLFPHTKALNITDRLVAANFVPEKNTWRMTLTYEGIHRARNIVFYVLGDSKSAMVKHVLTDPLDIRTYPAQGVGRTSLKALWLLDQPAASQLGI